MQKAIWRFSRERCSQLAQSIGEQLRKIPATCIYGEDVGLKTLWDEYCFHVFQGEETMSLEQAWRATIDPYCAAAMETVNLGEKQVLYFATENWMNTNDDESSEPFVDLDSLLGLIASSVRKLAQERDMTHFALKSESIGPQIESGRPNGPAST
jgi:hypothetical protein